MARKNKKEKNEDLKNKSIPEKNEKSEVVEEETLVIDLKTNLPAEGSKKGVDNLTKTELRFFRRTGSIPK